MKVQSVQQFDLVRGRHDADRYTATIEHVLHRVPTQATRRAPDEHDVALFEGTERFFRPNYAANLVTSWIPALDGVDARLKQGARVAERTLPR